VKVVERKQSEAEENFVGHPYGTLCFVVVVLFLFSWTDQPAPKFLSRSDVRFTILVRNFSCLQNLNCSFVPH